jgi:hypothetical protein
MLEAASVLSAYLAFALLHGADPRRLPRPPHRPPPAWAMRVAALAAYAAAITLWARADGLGSALLVGVATSTLCASVFVLMSPVVPRIVWGLAATCPVVVAVLAVRGGLFG